MIVRRFGPLAAALVESGRDNGNFDTIAHAFIINRAKDRIFRACDFFDHFCRRIDLVQPEAVVRGSDVDENSPGAAD